MMRTIAILAILILAFSFGCAKTIIDGKKIDSSKTSQLMIGSTTPENIEALFGKPGQVQDLPNGEKKFMYHYYYNNPHWWTIDETEKQDLDVVFKNGKLDRYNLKEALLEGITTQPAPIPRN